MFDITGADDYEYGKKRRGNNAHDRRMKITDLNPFAIDRVHINRLRPIGTTMLRSGGHINTVTQTDREPKNVVTGGVRLVTRKPRIISRFELIRAFMTAV